MSETPPARLLVPVGDSATLRQTVGYAVSEVLAASEAGAESPALHFVVPVRRRGFGEERARDGAGRSEDLLEQVTVWAQEDLGLTGDGPVEHAERVTVETATIGRDRHLFSPGDYATVIDRYTRANDVDRVVLDPEYTPAGSAPMLVSLEAELGREGLDTERAPVERRTRRARLAGTVRPRKFVAVFALSFGFYLLLGDPFYWFDVVTGVGSAALTAAVLSRVTFIQPPSSRQLGAQGARFCLYTPYLLWEIAKANVQLAYVILHPSLPIDPEVVEYDAAVWGSVPTATLANSITLTPGTLTIDVLDDTFHVHALVPGAREGLLGGALERGVRFVFYGRRAARIASPAERRRVGETGETPEPEVEGE